jgi:hypothetical protein
MTMKDIAVMLKDLDEGNDALRENIRMWHKLGMILYLDYAELMVATGQIMDRIGELIEHGAELDQDECVERIDALMADLDSAYAKMDVVRKNYMKTR